MEPYIPPRQAHDRRLELQLVDVREQAEWDQGHIQGAVHIPLNDLLAGRTEDLDPDRPVVAYCRTANRSEVARLMLLARGFEAYTMEGGGEAWEAEGLPMVTQDGRPGRCA